MAAGLVRQQAASSVQSAPSGVSGNQKQLILAMMTVAAIIVFVQHARSGQPQDAKQYAAIGVVGFVLLLGAEFAPELAFAFALLFLVGVVLNSPNGVPFLSAPPVQQKGK